jgi:hypothetical protein
VRLKLIRGLLSDRWRRPVDEWDDDDDDDEGVDCESIDLVLLAIRGS